MLTLPDIIFRFLFVVAGYVFWLGLATAVHAVTGLSEASSMALTGIVIFISCIFYLERKK